MGLFKSMRDLQKQANEIEAGLPPVGQRLADAQSRMAAASQMMAAQTQQANAAMSAAASGVDMTATITGMRQIGAVNFDLMMEFDLTVMPGNMPPYPATAHQTITQMQLVQLRPGATVHVKVDPNNPLAIWRAWLELHQPRPAPPGGDEQRQRVAVHGSSFLADGRGWSHPGHGGVRGLAAAG